MSDEIYCLVKSQAVLICKFHDCLLYLVHETCCKVPYYVHILLFIFYCISEIYQEFIILLIAAMNFGMQK